jgi:predicted MFS family arabinose efflux permease
MRLDGIGSMLKPGVLILGGVILFLSLGIAVQTPAIGAYTHDQLRIEMHEAAFLLLLPGSAAVVVALRCSHLSDRFGRHWPLVIGLAVTGLSLFALTLTHNAFLAVNLAVLAGLAYAISVPAWCAAAIDATQVHCRGLLLGAFAAVQGLGGAVGQAVGGKVSETYGPVAPFNFAAILLGVAVIFAVLHIRHARSHCPVDD